LHNVRCLVVQSNAGNSNALVPFLAAAGVTAQQVADADTAARLAENSDEMTVVIEHLGDKAPADASLLASCQQRNNQVNLFIARGPRTHARIVGPQLVLLQTNAIRRRDFLHAVAVAAGRASPEITARPLSRLVRGQLVAPTVAQARTDGRLILVAEDDAINQKVILRQLALLGYAGEMASNGNEALRMWREGSYALLLTDLHMPEIDGYALAQTIRSEEPAGSRLPIIALTANALRGEAERAAAVGFDAYLTKPLQLSVLSATLDEWIPQVRSQDQASYMQAASAASGSAPAIDLQVLRGIIGDDEALLREFLGDYLTSSENQVAELHELLGGADYRRIATYAHRHKGAARAIGATRLGDVCAELENAARADDRSLLVEIAAQFERRAAEVSAEIEALLQSASEPGLRPTPLANANKSKAL
jgi:CheY-like chemotaxis protein/HPt (histidine-containing phosphotransfer) domain-containing protein